MVRFQTRTFVYNLGGRRTNTCGSAVRVWGGHHEGNNYFAPGCTSDPSLPSYCRIVYIATRKLRWCSVDSVAFHSFVWPKNVKEAKGIARTLFTNHCDWVDVLIVRGRCFSSSKVSFRANRVSDNLLWNWPSMRRPYVVYTEGEHGTRYVDPVPAWLKRECAYPDLCLCHLLGPRRDDWHRRGSLYSNVVCHEHQAFENYWGGYCRQCPFPVGCNKNIMNVEIATKFSRVVIHALSDAPPSVPRRGEPLVSVLGSRKLKPKWERGRLRAHKRWRVRCWWNILERRGGMMRRGSGYYSEIDE